MHMHLVMFQLLDRQPFTLSGTNIVTTGPRVPAPPTEAGWKDTVQCKPNEITRVIARFDDFTGKYPYHCHILEHEDHEMMRQFEVLPPPRITAVQFAGSDVQVSFTTTSNRLHLVQRRDDLATGSWTTLTNNVLGTGGIKTASGSGAAALPHRYYRVGLQP